MQDSFCGLDALYRIYLSYIFKALTGGMVVIDQMCGRDCKALPSNQPYYLYEGIQEALEPLLFSEAILLISTAMISEGMEFNHDTAPSVYFNGTTVGIKAPRKADLEYRWTCVWSISGALLVSNVLGFFIDVQSSSMQSYHYTGHKPILQKCLKTRCFLHISGYHGG